MTKEIEAAVADALAANPGLALGEVLQWLPIIAQAAMVVPQLATAKVGDTVGTPVIPNVRLTGGRFDVVVDFTKKA